MVEKLNNTVAKIPLPGWVVKFFDVVFLVMTGLVAGLIAAPDRPDLVTAANDGGVKVILVLFVISVGISIIQSAKEAREEN